MASEDLPGDAASFGPTGGPVLGYTTHEQRAILDLSASLAERYHGKDRIVVSHGHVLYWNPDDPRDRLETHVFVVKDHELRSDEAYRLWEEGKPPDWVLEVLSPIPRVEGDPPPEVKRGRYEQLKVPEYFLFEPDPTKPGPYRKKATPKNPAARLCGLRLKDGEYARIDPEPDGSIRSEELGVTVRVEGGSLRLRHAKTGRVYLWREEQSREIRRQKALARRAEAEAEEAEHRAEQAETKAIESRSKEEEIKRLKQQLLDLQRPKRRNTYYGR